MNWTPGLPPKDGDEYLAFTRYGRIIVLWNPDEEGWEHRRGKFPREMEECTHWMPLPDAPEGYRNDGLRVDEATEREKLVWDNMR